MTLSFYFNQSAALCSFWWRRGELNPCPKMRMRDLLRAQSVVFIPRSPASNDKGRSRVASYLHLTLKALDNGVPCNYDAGKPLLQAARAGGSRN